MNKVIVVIVFSMILFGMLFNSAGVIAENGNGDNNSNGQQLRIHSNDSDDEDDDNDANETEDDDNDEDENGFGNVTRERDRERNGTCEDNCSKVQKIVDKLNDKTGLNFTVEQIGNQSLGQMLRIYTSNGRWALVKIMPENAAEKAKEKLKAKCDERNCSVELREKNWGNETRAMYKLTVMKESKLFGFMKKNMRIETEVDAENGNVTSVKKPWWAFIAKED